MEVNSSDKNNSLVDEHGEIACMCIPRHPCLPQGWHICRSLGFSIWGCDTQAPQTQKGLEATALSSQIQISVFKTVMKWETLEAGKMGKKKSKQFPLWIFFFYLIHFTIQYSNECRYEMEEEGQSTADLLGGKKMSFKHWETYLMSKNIRSGFWKPDQRARQKEKIIFSIFIMCLTWDS